MLNEVAKSEIKGKDKTLFSQVGTEMTTLIKDEEVKTKCELIYFSSSLVKRNPNKEIQTLSDVSWRHWKKICGIRPQKQRRDVWLTTDQVKKLVCLTYLKAANPNGHHTYRDVLFELFKPNPDWQARLDAIAYAPNDALITPAKGKELPTLIKRLTGASIKLDSIEQRLRRVGKENEKIFSRRRRYTADQVNWWIQAAYPDLMVS